MSDKEFVTKDLCEERSDHIIKTVDKLSTAMDKHCNSLDLTIAEIFKLIKERNNKDAYNNGFTDGNKSRVNFSYKILVAIIAGINGFLLGLVELIKVLVK